MLAAPGCAEEWGAETWPSTTVRGLVTDGQKPVGGGWIEFFPTLGAKGVLRSAPVRPDGTFVAEKVAVGVNTIGLVGAPLPTLAWRRHFETFTSKVRRTIPPGPSSEVRIDLFQELVREQSGEGR